MSEKESGEKKVKSKGIHPRDVWKGEKEREELVELQVQNAFKLLFGSGSLALGLLISAISNRKAIKSGIYNSFSTENFSYGLMGAGVLILASRKKELSFLSHLSGDKTSSADSKFVFELLNEKLAKEFDSFEDFSPKIPEWLTPRLMHALEVLEEAEVIENEKDMKSVRTNFYKQLRSDVDSKVSASEILAKLNPRTFVFEFIDDNSADDDSKPNSFRQNTENTRGKEIVTGMTKVDHENLSDVITFLCHTCTKYDEVCVLLTSPGGSVIDYGFCSAEFTRLRKCGVKLTFLIDKVAASGGYLVCCTGDNIVSSPFGIVGSIGVVAEMLNGHKLLEKLYLDYEIYTAGKYKRTVHPLQDNSEEMKEKFKEELEQVHQAFKDVVSENRLSKLQNSSTLNENKSNFDVEKVSTGEHWFAIDSVKKGLGLVDEIMTSSEYLMNKAKSQDVILVRRKSKKKKLSLMDVLVDMSLKLNMQVSELVKFLGESFNGVKFIPGSSKILAKL